MTDFDDEATPLPAHFAPVHDVQFPTGRMPKIANGALHPQRAKSATTRLWSMNGGATTRMSARELAACVPLSFAANDPMATVRVSAAQFSALQPPTWRARLRPFALPVLGFALGLLVGGFLL